MLRLLVVVAALGCASRLTAADTHQIKLNGQTFTLPVGFEIELAAGPNVVPRPITADFDEKGRLYVADSSGSNENVNVQLKNPTHRILRLESTKGDGKFDKSTVFADKMMFPEGTMWLNGSLYVAAPPHIWKLTDTNGDGVADKRDIWFDGKTLTGCANDLHGPYRGPDGYIYWCKGAFAKQEYTLPTGKKFTTRASHIFRAKPDGTGIEPVMTGGMDNPVDVVFLPNGERFFTTTFLQHPAGGKRDGIIHAIYGAVYGKDHDPVNEHPWTAPTLMPPMTHLGAAAPAGLHRYESDQFGAAFTDNLFACCFNMHKVTRHVLVPDGATYETKDSDFVVSDSLDFHPTDVLEDADGSLLIVDTGGWYKLCCPTSQLVKPDIVGGIYRVRKTGAHKNATKPQPKPLPMLYTIALTRDAAGLPDALVALKHADLHSRRRAAEALGRIGDPMAVPAILDALADEKNDRVLEHSLTYALIEIGDAKQTAAGLKHESEQVRRQALIALDQMPNGKLNVEDLLANLRDEDSGIRKVAWWIARRHPEWGAKLTGYVRERLREVADDAVMLAYLPALAKSEEIQKVLAEAVLDFKAHPDAAWTALFTMELAGLKATPTIWFDAVTFALTEPSVPVARLIQALQTARQFPKQPGVPDKFRNAILKVGTDTKQSVRIRLEALASLPHGTGSLDEATFEFLLKHLGREAEASHRSAAVGALARLSLTPSKWQAIAVKLSIVPATEMARVVSLFENSKDADTGLALVTALHEPAVRAIVRLEQVKPILDKYPAKVQEAAKPLYAAFAADRAGDTAKLEALLKELPTGDIRRGQVVFHNTKAACITCHAMGYLGGKLGPDLTKIGGVRAERDLLEAIVFPNASFVRSYEPVKVNTVDGRSFNGILKSDVPDEVIVAISATEEVRIARADVDTMVPGTVSVMPSGLDQQLSKQELADLIAFLKASK